MTVARIISLRARPVCVPMRRPLHTGGGSVSIAPLVLIDLVTDQGITGCSYVFCYTPIALKPMALLIQNLEALIKDEPLAPFAIERKLEQRFRLLGPQGLAGMAMAGIDMAVWDALAKAQGVPLARLLGGAPRPIPAYNSCGLGIIGPERAAAEARDLVAPGFKAIKVRLGYPTADDDVAVIRAVREAVGPDVALMTDYNQCLSAAEAISRAHRLDDEGIYWIEEPILADDYAGCAQVSRAAKTPVQLGENLWGPRDLKKAIAADAADFVMPDATKIGGVTGWLKAAALAEAAGLPMSCHLFPEISAHLLAVTPTAHWLEYVDWAEPVLQQPVGIDDGRAIANDTPGSGIAWNEDAVQRLLVT